MSLVTPFSIISIVLYFGCTMLIARCAYSPIPGKPVRVIQIAALIAAGLQAWLLYQLMFTPNGLNFNFFNSASLIGLEIVLITLIASLIQPVINLGVIIFPLVGLSVLGAWLTPVKWLTPDTGWGMNAHIIVSLSAYSLLSIAAVQALLLAVQDYRLHHRKTDKLIGILPPLQIMEQFMFQTILAGFVFLSLSLFSGFVFVSNLLAQRLGEKTILSLLAWFVFAVLLWGRWRFGWRGRTAIVWTLGGFITLALAYFGSKLILELVFGQHWLAA